MSGTGQNALGERLRWHRMSAGLTQEELAEKSALSVRAISDIERGQTTRPLRTSLARIASALDLPDAERGAVMNLARRRPPGPPPGAAGPDPGPGPAAGRPGSAPPRQLPGLAAHFAGRAAELRALTGLLDEASAGSPSTVVISAIGGMAGVGKTALAVRWARQVADRFPDGQLYVNLRGYDPDQLVSPADALAGFLRALGVPGQEIPPEEDERAARYRSVLAGRRVLVVLDNAGSLPQVRPLLPGSPDCMVVVTSRDALAGLVARDGARRLELDALPLPDAVSLLRALIGDRVGAEPEAAAALAGQCSRLPLALRVAAELATARPDVTVAGLVEELADQRRRLDHLDAGGDPHTAVRTVLSWSYRGLDPGTARAFRLLSLHPGPDLDPYAAAALTDTAADDAARVLSQLARAHLLQPAAPGRYGQHDLLRAFGRELAVDRDGADGQRAALGRLFEHYQYSAATVMDCLFPAGRDDRPPLGPVPVTPVPPLDSVTRARAWLEAQRANLVECVAWAAENGWPQHATRLAATLHRYLFTASYFSEATALHAHALRAARLTGDRAAEADALTQLGRTELHLSQYDQARHHFEQALSLCSRTGDRGRETKALHNLAHLSLIQGHYREAIGQYEEALGLLRESGDRYGEAQALGNLGLLGLVQGRYEAAAGHARQALALFRELGDQTGEAACLEALGQIDLREGRNQDAARYLRLALGLFRETGNVSRVAGSLMTLGDLDRREGRYQEAAGHYERALEIFGQVHGAGAQAMALNGLGKVLLAAGRPAEARTRHAAALDLADQVADQQEQASAHDGLAGSYHAVGDLGLARAHWQQALALYTELGIPAADEVRTRLAAAGPAPSDAARWE